MSSHPFKVFIKQLTKVTVYFFMPVHMSVWNNLGHTGWIFVEFYIELLKYHKVQFLLQNYKK
jgi:hypothetical protein